jgi:hypothetical protein
MRLKCPRYLFVLVAASALLSPHCAAATVTCHVVDPTGKPVVGATVYVLDFDHLDVKTTVETDISGNFSVDVPPAHPTPPFNMYGCIVDASGMAMGGCVLKSSGAITIQLSLPIQITGTVIDATDNPVAGATVTINFGQVVASAEPVPSLSNRFFGISVLKARFTTTTTSRGVYSFTGLPAGSTVEITLNDPSYRPMGVTNGGSNQPDPPILATPATSISGQVIRQDGKPVGPVEVQALTPDPYSKAMFGSEAMSDNNGNFNIVSLAPGTYSVSIVEPFGTVDSPDWSPPPPITVTTALGKPGIAPNIVLSAGGTVTGTVVNGKSGMPIADVYLYFRDTNPGTAQMFRQVNATTDQNGQYSAKMWPGSADVTVYAVPLGYSADQTKHSIAVVSGQTVKVDPIGLMPVLSIVGKVVRQDGKPIGPILLLVSRSGSQDLLTSTKVETASDGTYKVFGLSSDNYSVSVANQQNNGSPQDWAPPAPLTVTTSSGGPATAPDITLIPGVTVTGTIIDADTKQPIPNVQLVIEAQNTTDQQPLSAQATTDKNGRYTAQVGLGHQKLTISNVPQGYDVSSSTVFRNFEAVNSQPLSLDQISLTKGITVVGTAVDEAGNTVPILPLQITRTPDADNSWMNVQPVTTNKNGDFTIQQLEPGSYTLDAGADWTVVSPATFNAPSSGPVKLILKKTVGSTLQGTVVDTSGAPISGVVLEFLRNHTLSNGSFVTDTVSATTDSDGFFAVSNVAIGPYMIQRKTVTKTGYLYERGGDVTTQGNQLTISLVVMSDLGGTVHGIVRNGLGAPVAAAWVVCPSTPGSVRPVQTDTTGHFSFSDLPIGPVDICAAKGDYYGTITAEAKATSTDLITVSLTAMPAPPTASDVAEGTQILTKLLADAVTAGAREPLWLMQDKCAQVLADASSAASLSFIESYRPLTARDLELIIPEQSKQNPVGAAQWGLPLILQTKKDGREGAVAASLGLDIAPYDMTAAVSLYNLAAQGISLDNLSDKNSLDASKLVALAYATKNPNADTMYQAVLPEMKFEVANNVAQHTSGMNSYWPMQELANDIALGNVPLAEQIMATMPENWRNSYVENLIDELIGPNPNGALDVFRTLDADRYSSSGAWAYDNALCHVLPILFASDPTEALVLAKDPASPADKCKELTALADVMPLTSARLLFQQAEDESNDQFGQGTTPASVAAHALLRDKALGEQLFKLAFDKVMTAQPIDQYGSGPSYAEFAFYYSRFDPSYSRLLIENLYRKDVSGEFAETFPCAGLAADALAMAAIDPKRALEMAESIKDPVLRLNAGLNVGFYVLQTQKTRDTLPFYILNASQWRSGEQQPW